MWSSTSTLSWYIQGSESETGTGDTWIYVLMSYFTEHQWRKQFNAMSKKIMSMQWTSCSCARQAAKHTHLQLLKMLVDSMSKVQWSFRHSRLWRYDLQCKVLELFALKPVWQLHEMLLGPSFTSSLPYVIFQFVPDLHDIGSQILNRYPHCQNPPLKYPPGQQVLPLLLFQCCGPHLTYYKGLSLIALIKVPEKNLCSWKYLFVLSFPLGTFCS
jgi:hypothetical protein